MRAMTGPTCSYPCGHRWAASTAARPSRRLLRRARLRGSRASCPSKTSRSGSRCRMRPFMLHHSSAASAVITCMHQRHVSGMSLVRSGLVQAMEQTKCLAMWHIPRE